MDEKKELINPELEKIINQTHKEAQEFCKTVREEHEKFMQELRENE